ncbi:MAG: TolC family protein [Bacteroidales bacterium]|nr:TolC family protein [Bacteroidales bacterium]
MKKPAIIILFFLLAFGTVNAQKVWTLEDCINHALENNIQVKQYLLRVENAHSDVFQSKINMLPNLNGYVSHGWNWGQAIDRFTNQFATERVQSNNFYGSSTVTIFNGFQKVNTVRKSQYDLMATKFDTDKFLDDISLSIAMAYLQILYAQEYVAIAENQINITRQQVERMKKLVTAGTLAQGDLLTIEAQLAAEDLQGVEAQNNLDLAFLTLVQMLDLPLTDGFTIERPVIEFYESQTILMKPDQIFSFAMGKQPGIKSNEMRYESAMRSLAIARGAQSPNIQMVGSWGTGYSGAQKIGKDEYLETIPIGYTSDNKLVTTQVVKYGSTAIKPFADQFNDNNNRTIDFRVNVPIFNGWYTRTSINKAKIAMQNAEFELESSKLQLNKTIQQAWADANASFKKYNASNKKVIATQESFKYADQRFNLGMLTSLDYNNAKKELQRAQSEMLQSKYDYVFKTKVLDFYMGLPLSIKN